MGVMDKLTAVAIGLVSLVIVVVLGALILNGFASTSLIDSTTNTSINTGKTELLGIVDNWVPVVVVAVVGAAILGIVLLIRKFKSD